MLKFIAIFMLLATSIAIPPLLLIALPAAYLYGRGILRRRREALELYHGLRHQKAQADLVKYFR